MKKVLIVLIGLIFLISCSRKMEIYKMTKEEESRYKILNDTIYHDNEKVAYLDLIEWEYYNDRMIQEISIVQFNKNEQDKTIHLISFIHKRHPDAKIEVKFKSENRNLN